VTGSGDVHGEISGTVQGPVVMGRDFSGTTINIVSPPGSRAAIALDEAADGLAQALRVQWTRESERQRLWAPDALTVRWRLSSPGLRDHWRTVRRASDDDRPLPLAGRLSQIAQVYRRVPSGRLVVLGRAGSGKSVLAIRFVLDMLGPPGTRVAAVPVIFSLGSWNPATPVRDWLTGQLERDHPGLAAAGPGRSTLAAALVDRGRVLPVLDGFDEIAKDLRCSALEKLNDTANSEMPLFMTSRPRQYAAAVVGTGVLTAAAGIQLKSLSLHDLEQYLPYTARNLRTGGKDGESVPVTAWSPVLHHLRDARRDSADSPLAKVLRSPLMVSLARTVYSGSSNRDPAELLDSDRFGTPRALEDHLLDSFISAAYRDRSLDHRERVQRWLGHLARHLALLDTPDLKWWQLGGTLSRRVRMVVVGSVAGAALGLVNGLVSWYQVGVEGSYDLVGRVLIGLASGAVLGLVAGLAFALVYALLDGDAAREPSRVRMRILGRTTGARRTCLPRLAAGAAGGFGFGAVTWLVNALANGLLEGRSPATTLRGGLLNALVGGLVDGLLLGLAYAGGADEPSDDPLRFTDALRDFRGRLGPRLAIGFAGGFGGGFLFWFTDPLGFGLVLGAQGGFPSLLTNSLRLGIEGGLGYGLVVALVYGLAVALSDPIPVRSAVSPTDLLRTDRRAVAHRTLLSTLTFGLVGWLFYGLGGQFLNWFVFTTVGGLGLGIAYGLALTAWGQWTTLARIWLPLTGRLPRDPAAFLEDAHHRGVLRQAGAVYQFRHSRLRDRLDKP